MTRYCPFLLLFVLSCGKRAQDGESGPMPGNPEAETCSDLLEDSNDPRVPNIAVDEEAKAKSILDALEKLGVSPYARTHQYGGEEIRNLKFSSKSSVQFLARRDLENHYDCIIRKDLDDISRINMILVSLGVPSWSHAENEKLAGLAKDIHYVACVTGGTMGRGSPYSCKIFF